MIKAQLSDCRWHGSYRKFQDAFNSPIAMGISRSLEPANCLFAKQVHGIKIIKVGAANAETFAEKTPEADGLWTIEAGIAIAVKTADCLPVILYGKSGGFILVLHAGWRGLTSGIVQQGVEIAMGAGHSLENISAIFGPCISPAKFEIGPEVVAAFAGKSMGLTETQIGYSLTKGVDDRWHADLALAGVSVLLNCGVSPSHIDVIRECTFDSKNNWASFRRDGRSMNNNWTWAQLKK